MASGFIASAILSPLCKRLINTALQEYELVRDVKEEVGKLRFTVFLIQQVLQDAEQKQVKEEFVRHWLRSLKQLLYDAEDILDEAATDSALERRRVEHGASRSVNPIFGCGSIDEFLSRRELAHQIKDIRMQLDAIYKEKDALRLEGLITSDENIWPAAVNTKRRRPDTSSLLMADKPCIVGRDDEKRKIMEMLMGSELESSTSEPASSTSNNVHVLSLVGMGGVGKTTLAQLVFSDPTMEQYFHVRIWVCVSENFDVNRITKEILEVISSSTDQQKESFEISKNWDSAQRRLKAKIEGKKFLLVLDDVWEDDPSNWESLYGPLTYGGKGSRIIVTTRNQKVSNMVKASCVPLKSLSDEDLWPILKGYAFDGGSELHGLLESIGRQMVKKLKGSPLAAKTIGRLLNQRLDVRHWKNILDSEIFMLEQQHSDDISPVLKLSYDHLPGHLKQCFAYCSLFPKDYKFSRFELAPHWLAQNFIPTPRGDQHFDDLLDMSFFEESKQNIGYLMHDLIHDLAESISDGDCLRLGDDVRPIKSPEAIRHVSIANGHLDPMKLEELCKYGKLRTLHFLSQPRFHVSPLLLNNLFTKLKRLRVLGLGHCRTLSELPTSIGKLKHLRFVDLSWTSISELPESFCGLHNLQVLKLEECWELRALPGNMSALVNLMHLELSDVELVSSIQDLGKLTALQELDIMGVKAKELGDMSMLRHLQIRNLEEVTGKEEAAQARLDAKKYLETLGLGWRKETLAWRNCLFGMDDHPSSDDHGTLEEGVLEGLQSESEEEEGVLADLQSEEEERVLADLQSESEEEEGVLDGLQSEEEEGVLQPAAEEGVLEGLQPVSSITKLFIYKYGGVRSPRWLEDPAWVSSSFLKRVELTDCKNWEVLPPLGQLRGLKELEISRMSSVRRIDPGKGGGGGGFEMLGFPSLERLKFTNMPEWEEWEAPHHHGDDDEEEGQQQQQQQIAFLPRLRTLYIDDCPKLKELPPLPRSLESLNIWKVGLTRLPRLVGCCGGGGDAGRDADYMSLSELSELYIAECPNLRSLNDDDGLLQHPLPRLLSLSIRRCRELTSLPVRAFTHFTSLKLLAITDCPKLISSSLPSVSTADEAMPCSPEVVWITDGGHMMEYLLVAIILPKLTRLSILHVSVGSSSTAQLLLNSILENQSVTATLRILQIRRDHHRRQQHQACSSSSNYIPSLIVPHAPPPPPPLEMEKVAGGATNNLRDHLTSLTSLEIGNCSDLLQLSGLPSSLKILSIYGDTHLDDSILATYLQGLCRLRSLSIDGCPHITSLPTAEVLCHLTALQDLNISHCQELMSWGGGVHNLIALQDLSIFECPNIQCLPSVGLPKSLRKVSINGSSIPTRH